MGEPAVPLGRRALAILLVFAGIPRFHSIVIAAMLAREKPTQGPDAFTR